MRVKRIAFLASALVVWSVSAALTEVRWEVDTLPGGIVLEHNHRYVVNPPHGTLTISASGLFGVSGIRVPVGMSAVIEIPTGKELDVSGGAGYGRIPGGAGIEVPFGSKLVVVGEGVLRAAGGQAAAGGRGTAALPAGWER